MNRFNHWLVILIVLLLVIHGLTGSYTLLGFPFIDIRPLPYVLAAAVVLHSLIGLFLTRDAIRIGLKTGHWYWKENARFWIVRLSGICALILLGFHACVYTGTVNGVFFLKRITFLRMVSQLLFVASIAVHLVAAAKPWLIKQGVLKFEERSRNCLAVTAILTAVFTVSIIMYYIYWTGL